MERAGFFLVVLAVSGGLVAVTLIVGSLSQGLRLGTFWEAMGKSAALALGLAALVCFVSFGSWLTLPVWFFGLMYLFDADPKNSLTLTGVGWGLTMGLTVLASSLLPFVLRIKP